MRDRFHPLVEAGDLNALLREVDALCERRDWQHLALLADMCRQAVERGKQVWPIAEHIEFRMILEGPPEFAGPLVLPGAGRFAPGPLTEVAASTHTFSELADHLPSAQARELVAAERVLRGEDLSKDPRAYPPVIEVPLRLLEVEPSYRLATYRKDHVEVEEPLTPAPSSISSPSPAERLEEEELEEALLDLVRPWFEESGGSAEAVVCEGGALAAIGTLRLGEVATAEITFQQALELMAWAAASGGAHGRRRGAAFGRFSAWWTTTQMCELLWPPEPHELLTEGSNLDWLIFDRILDEQSGWRLGLACSSLAENWGCALYARDFEPPEIVQ